MSKTNVAGTLLLNLALPLLSLLSVGVSQAQLAQPDPFVYGSDTCVQGYVWRDAFQGDHVCVTPRVRDLTRQENALAASHRSPGGGNAGPDTCLQGYVWRETIASDHVCVTPQVRQRAAYDNTQAAARRVMQAGARLPYGPDTCMQGYVWRETIASDHVCVTPDVRRQAVSDNAQAAARRNPLGGYGSNTCANGYVWREAFQGDAVCVTPDIRQQTRDDSAQASARRAQP
ncbi:hypothetical protein [Deinococcus sp.]|uniref:hypothetical protein n=1 Tax=Deinococcus sp. TaxID=47478 RepID=UPI003CC5DC3F